ncbi:MAG: hypothetical protein H7Y11_14935 [Armatimonadetes bacterium]|nr:hypothetical protein [Anaerolineae bacterium]
MIVLQNTTIEAITQFGCELFIKHRSQLNTFESAAQTIVRELYEAFSTPQGDPLFSLVRIFRFSHWDDLSPALQQQALATSQYWLALMGTHGQEAAWGSRHSSMEHQIIPADSAATPMLQAAFQQIGLRFGAEAQTASTLLLHEQNDFSSLQHFYVPQALGSPHIPAQEDFVIPYGIQSVVGFGSPMLRMSAYLCLCFTRSMLTAADVDKFVTLNLFISALLSRFNHPGSIWQD